MIYFAKISKKDKIEVIAQDSKKRTIKIYRKVV